MTITFPVECPTAIKPGATRWSTISAVIVDISQTTLQATQYEYDGEAWAIEVSYPALTRVEAAPFFAFLASMRGRNGTFLFGDTLLRNPLGLGAGTPLVAGSNQVRSKVLTTDGWTASQTVLKAGDFLQIDQRIYMALADVQSNASGEASIDVFPRLRAHADNAPVIITNPKGIFRLADDQISVVDVGQSQLFNISFRAEEAL